MKKVELKITSEVGLHAKPADLFVRAANRFNCDIRVSNLTTGSAEVNGKSILHILSLGVYNGHVIRVSAHGEDEQAALESLSQLVYSNFPPT